jgi:hypothetical protein
MHPVPAAVGKNTRNAAEKTCKEHKCIRAQEHKLLLCCSSFALEGEQLKRKHRATNRHPMFSGGEKKSFFNFFLLSAAAQSHFNRK